MSHKPILIEVAYLPPIQYFTYLARGPVIFEAQETFQKRTFRNKCFIASNQGPHRLSVPLRKGKHQSQPITKVAIAYDDPWQQQHIRGISTCYSSAPFYDHFFPAWQKLLSTNFPTLWDLNWACLILAVNQLDIPVQIALTLQYEQKGDRRDLRGTLHPRNYQDFAVSTYPQVFMDSTGFLPNLSILDLIFCCGPAGRLLL